MIQRFETFVTVITQIYRSIQKLKSQEMAEFGLKGAHVMCLVQLYQHTEGLTSAQLVQSCEEDKAAVSRALAELRERGLVVSEDTPKRYRTKMQLTEEGRRITQQMDSKILEVVGAGGAGYTPEEREVFYRVLLQIAENLQRACGAKDGPSREC